MISGNWFAAGPGLKILVVAAALSAGAGTALAQAIPNNVLVAVGVGYTGTWNTELEVANGTGAALEISVDPQLDLSGICQPGTCPKEMTAPPNGNARVEGPFGYPSLVGVLYLIPSTPSVTSFSVRSRIFNISRPTQSIEVPVFNLSHLLALNPSVLSFPSATRTAVAHSNLVISEVSGSGALSLLVEAFSESGEALGSLPLAITADPQDVERRSVFLIDVLARLGVPELELGQVRITKLGGSGVMWGTLANVYSDGRVLVSVGKNP